MARLLANLGILILAVSLQTACNTDDIADLREDGESNISWPLPVSGTYLTFENARIRCDYKGANAQKSKFDVSCLVVAASAMGESAVASLPSDLDLEWNAPRLDSGNASAKNCTVDPSKLSMKCMVQLDSNSAKINFGVNVVKKAQDTETGEVSKQSRNENSLVIFPFYVGVAAGFIPSMPFYKSQSAESLSLVSNPAAESEHLATPVGFQYKSFHRKSLDLNSTDMCFSNGALYVVDGNQIFKVENDQAQLYVGSTNGKFEDLSHRLRVYLSPTEFYPNIGCAEDGLYISDYYHHRILFVSHNDPKVKLIAGTGEPGFSGDGGLATKAQIKKPHGLYAHPNGELFIVDYGNKRIRKIDKHGIISTVAGNGNAVSAGDGGLAIEASFWTPEEITFDLKTNRMFISDFYGRNIRVIKDGVITTFAGKRAALAQQQQQQQQSQQQQQIQDELITGGDAMPALSVALLNPIGLAFTNAGELIITESLGKRVRLVDANGVIHTIAGTGTTPETIESSYKDARVQGLVNPYGLAYDSSSGQLVFADNVGERSRALGGGRIWAATLRKEGANYRASSSLFIGETSSETNEKILAHEIPANEFNLDEYSIVAVSPKGDVYLSKFGQIRRLDNDKLSMVTKMTNLFGSDSNISAAQAGNLSLLDIKGMIFDTKGHLYIFALQPEQYSLIRLVPDGDQRISSNSRAEILDINLPISRYVGIGGVKFAKDGSLLLAASKSMYRVNLDSDGDLSSESTVTQLATLDVTGYSIADFALGKNQEIYVFQGSAAFNGAPSKTFVLRADASSATGYQQNFESITQDRYSIAAAHALSTGEILAIQNLPQWGMAINTHTSVTENQGISKLKFAKESPSDTNLSTEYETFLDIGNNADCGSGKIADSASRTDLKSTFESSVSVICRGVMTSFTLSDNCLQNPTDGTINIYFLQSFGPSKYNLVQVVRPCVL